MTVLTLKAGIVLSPIEAEALYEAATERSLSTDPQLGKLAEKHWMYADDGYRIECLEWRKPLRGGAKLWLILVRPGDLDVLFDTSPKFGSKEDPVVIIEMISSDDRAEEDIPSYKEVLKDGCNELVKKASSRAVPFALLIAFLTGAGLWFLLSLVVRPYLGVSDADSWFIPYLGAAIAFIVAAVIGENKRVNELPVPA